ncbi:MAG TPA: hypothetical protein ENK57_02620 [Polyangiaceae bacterium]|nr:hypothetical protein [Polyangiaceae bacterium]
MFAVITSVVLLSAMLMAGNAYAWCPHMQRASAGCCHGSEAPSTRDEAQAHRGPQVDAPCCETRVLSELPAADRSPNDAVVAPAAMILPAPVILDEPAPRFLVREAERAQVRAPIRAGPATALERCVLLQTFLR